MHNRRQFAGGCLGLLAAAQSQLRAAPDNDHGEVVRQIDRALDAAAEYLRSEQAADGSWRSKHYGPLQDGPSLTSLIAAALSSTVAEIGAADVLLKATTYLNECVPRPPGISGQQSAEKLSYPVYTAAGAIIAMRGSTRLQCAVARSRWLTRLRQLQLVEENGWDVTLPAYGGWSYAADAPRPVDGKPPTPLAVPNLSATAFALDAFHSTGVPASDQAMQSVRIFVERCQNWGEPAAGRDLHFDDGGFCYLVEDTVRNKAGEAGVEATGRVRFASYGSATADGLRALLACGLPVEHPRVVAAQQWLTNHFSAEEHPGEYAREREHLRSAVYYYYCASVAQALSATKSNRAIGDFTPRHWPTRLAKSLLDRQRPDGSWANPVVEVREDDPLVATPLAMQALARCRNAWT